MNDIDELGFPGTEGDDGKFDGGDTMAIIGNLIALGSDEIFPSKLRTMRAILIRPEGPCRHHDRKKWYGQPDRFSRDQLIPLLCSWAGETPTADTRQVLRQHRAHWFFYAWNTRKNGVMDTPPKPPDFTGPEIWALWIRVMDPAWYIKIWLPLLDLETLVGSIIWRWFQPETNRVTRNHMLVCLTGMKVMPSITMRLANWLNNWPDLLGRWRAHTAAVKEYPTANLFEKAIKDGNEDRKGLP